MSVISDKLEALGYRPLVKTDRHDPDRLTGLAGIVGHPIPSDYQDFLRAFPDSGAFDEIVVCVGIEASPGAPDRRYLLPVLYASCSLASSDLLRTRSLDDELPAHFLTIAHDNLGNAFCLDLQPPSAGQVHFWDHEMGWREGMVLLARDFTGFIDQLVVDEDD